MSTSSTALELSKEQAPPGARPAKAISSSFSWMVQWGAVACYVGSDTILRFLYHRLVDQNTDSNGEEEDASIESVYDKPLALSYACYAVFGLWIIPVALYVRFGAPVSSSSRSVKDYFVTSWCGALGFHTAVLYWCVPVVFLLSAQNYFYVAALRYIRVAISTAVGQSEAPFTVFLTIAALGRNLGKTESFGVAISFLGIALIAVPPLFRIRNTTYSDEDDDGPRDTSAPLMLLGILMTIVAAFFYSLYQIFWQFFDEKRFPNPALKPSTPADCIADTMATVAIIGLCNIVIGPIVLFVAHVVNIETFELPPVSALGPILVACTVSAFVDAMNGVACVVATAVVVSMAYPLTIPLSVLIEAVWTGIPLSTWGLWGWVGTILVIAGIFFLETEEIDIEQVCMDDDTYMCACEHAEYALEEDQPLERHENLRQEAVV